NLAFPSRRPACGFECLRPQLASGESLEQDLLVPIRLINDPDSPIGELGELGVPRGSGRYHPCLLPGLTAVARAADRGAAAQVRVGRVGGEELPAGGKNRTVRARVDEIGGGDGRRERLPAVVG